jgi:hypothetical protein
MNMTTSANLRRALTVAGAAAVLGSVLTAPAQASSPGIRWDTDGMAEITAPPFTFSLELTDFSSPQEITRRQVIRVDLSATTDVDACAATIRATPTLHGVAIGEPAYVDAVDSYDAVTLRFPVEGAGSYSLQIDGSIETGSAYCLSGPTASTPYATTIELFRIDKALPGPASTRPVSIASSGAHTLVANTWSRTGSIRVTFAIRDPEHRGDLLHSICMEDTYDCWFEDAPLESRAAIHRTSAGWLRTWDFWWERASPSDCVSYYWDQPDVSVILVVTNRDGKTVGRKKHTVKLTCRL